MPSVLWVSLPAKWKLEEVQAGLQVFIAVLCTWGIFAFSRFCWQLSSNLVKKNRAVALASLMSINTIGEAFDVIALLKRRIFLQRYWKLLAQSIVVISLTVATIISGPIAKASTRMGSKIKVTPTPGFLATNQFNSRTFANVDWNETSTSLNRAGFPLDQLLDYMPQPNSTWLYQPNEWNNSWSMTCNKTESTPVTLFDTGLCSNMSVELPATNNFFDYNNYERWYTDWHALFSNSTWLQDGLIILTGWNWPGWDSATNITYNMTVTVVAMHVHGMLSANDSTSCNFGRGQVDLATYTKMDCFLKRPLTVPDETHIAYPDCGDFFALSSAYIANYFDRMNTEANENIPVSIIPPDELIRFYQTYIITKDLQYPHPVERQLTSDLQVVQLSSTFIAFGSLYALVVILGLMNYGVFAYRNRDVIRETPESKLDWIVQSILDDSEALRTIGRNPASRRSVVFPSAQSEAVVRGSEKVRVVFENAKYGATNIEEVPLTDHAASQPGSVYGQSPTPGNEYMSPTAYGGYAGENPAFYSMNPYEASYATQQIDSNHAYELQNPQSIFASDQRRGYHRLG